MYPVLLLVHRTHAQPSVSENVSPDHLLSFNSDDERLRSFLQSVRLNSTLLYVYMKVRYDVIAFRLSLKNIRNY